MTSKETIDIAVIQNDVRYIKERIDEYCTKVHSLEKLVYVGLGIVLAIEGVLAYVK